LATELTRLGGLDGVGIGGCCDDEGAKPGGNHNGITGTFELDDAAGFTTLALSDRMSLTMLGEPGRLIDVSFELCVCVLFAVIFGPISLVLRVAFAGAIDPCLSPLFCPEPRVGGGG